MSLALIVLLPFVGSLCAAFLPSNARNAEAWLAGAVALVCTGLTISLYPDIAEGGVVRLQLPWLAQAGLEFYLRMDGFAWMFTLLVSLMGALVVLYARYYMSPEDPVPRFFSFLLAFMGSMLGIVLSGNLIQLVVFWELTSFSSFMLIAYWYHRVDARQGARMALTVTATGGFCLLAGVIMLGEIAGGYDLDHVLAAGSRVAAHPWYPAMLVLILLGALTKSAQFPFHFWLPHAMAAPTPVSAYLHSATMVKAGVFLLARLWPVLAGTDLWFALVCGAGLASLLLGAAAALFQHDMKGVLAYSTISHLGLVTLLLGMNSRLALVAAVFHMMNHATFKASLFMAAGIVDHETGTRDLKRLGGLALAMPITATVATVAAAAMAGVPLLNGFLSKEMFFAETIFAGGGPVLRYGLPAIATVAGMFSVAYSLRLIHQVFFGPPAQDLPRTPHEPTRGMLLPSMLLVLACLLVGILPMRTIGPLLDIAVTSILGIDTPEYSLAVWHGLTLPLLMSVIAMLGGLGIYLVRWFYGDRAVGRAPVRPPLDGRRAFDILIIVIHRSAERMVRFASSRRLQPQLLMIICVALAVGWIPIAATGWTRGQEALTPIDPVYALLWVVGCSCAIGAAVQAKFHRLAALIMMGGAGLVTCLTFAWFSAPDLPDTGGRRGGDAGSAAARPALAAAPTDVRRCQAPDAARARAARPRPARCDRGRRRAGRDLLCRAHPPPRRWPGTLLRRARAHRRRRTQHRQRDPGRLPRFRYLRRDHRRQHRRAHRVRAAAPVPAGAGESHRAPGAARGNRARRLSLLRSARAAPLWRHAHFRRAGAAAAADGGTRGDLPAAARAQCARRRLRRRPRDGDRVHHPVHGWRRDVGRVAHARAPAVLGGARSRVSGWRRHARVGIRPTVPEESRV